MPEDTVARGWRKGTVKFMEDIGGSTNDGRGDFFIVLQAFDDRAGNETSNSISHAKDDTPRCHEMCRGRCRCSKKIPRDDVKPLRGMEIWI